MSNISIPRGDRKSRTMGAWWNEGNHVCVSCPECGREGYLDHDIHKNGDVHPSVYCPKCHFHRFYSLEDWPRVARHA